MADFDLYEVLRLLMLGLMVPVVIYTELKDGKIYNWFTFPALIAGLLIAFLDGGVPGLKHHFWAALLGAGIFYIPYLISGVSSSRPREVIGGGDVKLFGAVGAIWGVTPLLNVIQYAIVAGAVLGLSMVAWQSWKNKQAGKTSPDDKISIWALRIPFGTPVCFGIIVTFTQFYLLRQGE